MEIETRKERLRRIWILILSAVILIGTVALGIHAKNKRDEITAPGGNPQASLILVEKKKIVEIEAKIADAEAEVLAFSVPYGFRTQASILSPQVPSTPISPDVIRGFLNRWRARLAERYGLTTYKDWGNPPDPNSPGLTIPKLFDEVRKLRDAAAKEEEALVKESGSIDLSWKWAPGGGPDIQIPAGTMTASVVAISKEAAEAQKKADDEVKRLREEMVTAVKAREEKKLELKTKRLAIDQALKEAQAKHTEAVQAQSQEKQKRLSEKKELQERLEWVELTRQEAQERQETDGRVIFSDAVHGVVYIDVRAQDGLFKGTKFKVFSMKKGGTKKMKGEIQVLDVFADYSRCSVTRNLDPDDLIAGGDYVFDEFYDRTRKLEFVFAGRFAGRATAAELIQKLSQNKRYSYFPKARRETSYLVVGEAYEKEPNYVEAVKFGIKIIREKDFYAFLGIDY
jgi:hypothetical protein